LSTNLHFDAKIIFKMQCDVTARSLDVST